MNPGPVDRLIVGCGYLGRRVADAWRAAGDSVAATTRSAEHAARFARDGLIPIVCDVLRPDTLALLPAARTVLYAVGWDRTSGATQHAVYVVGLRNVLDALVPHAVAARVGRIVHVSSTSVYGQSQGERIDEESPSEPQRENGRTCLAAERLLLDAADRTGFDAVVLRCAGLYGPGRLLRRAEEVRAGRPLTGAPDAWLNLIHVDDAVAAVRAAADHAAPPRLCLVSDDRPLRRADYYATLSRILHSPPPSFAPPDPSDGSAPDLGKRCDNRRLRETLGVRLIHPTIDTGLPAALAETDAPLL
jgi:nucleoside-diphosphate-sugar epimerase